MYHVCCSSISSKVKFSKHFVKLCLSVTAVSFGKVEPNRLSCSGYGKSVPGGSRCVMLGGQYVRLKGLSHKIIQAFKWFQWKEQRPILLLLQIIL